MIQAMGARVSQEMLAALKSMMSAAVIRFIVLAADF
jgi:hypothetical protein